MLKQSSEPCERQLGVTQNPADVFGLGSELGHPDHDIVGVLCNVVGLYFVSVV
jgi:hypothetical protein